MFYPLLSFSRETTDINHDRTKIILDLINSDQCEKALKACDLAIKTEEDNGVFYFMKDFAFGKIGDAVENDI